ncbi:DNA alkylation repair protein [Dyadobacter frigoris]|uniref:DNA alkylation repair protein n=1 Tax=Dyadobacter frigoris TaxID=2576211 RepID=A0A4U6D707_9BACT|nr:DNA alkylation repair protein [Dyadobacter frigoris]TKT92526.1 DNA alkylation repair protein [Dyadobacter frigoris]GLU55320.1 DNA alkylation repair protein [Dyadobacter frigoris]
MSLIKDIYSPAFYDRFADAMKQAVPDFSKKEFIRQIFTDAFKTMEWKERMKHTTRVFHEFLPTDFPKATKLIEKIITQLRQRNTGEDSLAYIFLADYVEVYGLDDFKTSVKALEFITQFISCEFAVRPFILKYGNQMIDQMVLWSTHENYKVRRFSSEGSRPRLPWAMAIPALKKDPSPLLPLLENLKNDPSEFVRRSVANNLNDIAKDHPDIVLSIAKKWRGGSKETDAIIKHGSRTLLKQGHAEILEVYGLDGKNINVTNLEISTPEVKIGDSLEFSFTITNANDSKRMVRLEYGIYYQKSKGHLARKVFKISEKEYEAGAKINVSRKQSFKLITTRTFYPGLHQLSIIVNGEEKVNHDFKITID